MPVAIQLHPVRIEHKGRVYNGAWHVEDKVLHVSSAYGSRSEPLGRHDPGGLAAKLLNQLLHD